MSFVKLIRSRTCRTVARRLTCAVLCVAWLAPGGLFGQDPVVEDPSSVDSVRQDQRLGPPDASEIQLYELASRGGASLGDALSAFARIKRWQYADHWLKEGVGPINDTAQLALIADHVGADNLLRLADSEHISDEAKLMIAKLGNASRVFAESKDRLAKAIDHLDATSIDQRLESARQLAAGGTAAIAALVEAAVNPNPPAPREDILRAMLKLSGHSVTSPGVRALRQFAIYGEPDVRSQAVEALTRIDRQAAMAELVTALYAVDASDYEKRFAKVNLPPITQTLPTITETRRYLFERLTQARRSALEAENDFDVVTLWSISQDRKHVDYQSARQIIAAYRDAADAANRLRRVGGLDLSMTVAALTVDVSYRVMINPDWGNADQIQSIELIYGDSLNVNTLSAAIELAISTGDYPAAVGVLRMIGQTDAGRSSQSLLVAGGDGMTPLVKATLCSEPQVRYEAAQGIVRLNPPASFSGASHFMRCLSEMRDLKNLPSILLVETRPRIAMKQELILGKMGYETEVVGSVLDLERCVSRGGDLRLVLSKTQLWDIPPVEMIDRVRRIPRGENVPIVFYDDPIVPEEADLGMKLLTKDELDFASESADEDELFAKTKPPKMRPPIPVAKPFVGIDPIPGINSNRWDALALQIDTPGTPAAFTNLLMDLDLDRRLPELTATDRASFRAVAEEFLQSRR